MNMFRVYKHIGKHFFNVPKCGILISVKTTFYLFCGGVSMHKFMKQHYRQKYYREHKIKECIYPGCTFSNV